MYSDVKNVQCVVAFLKAYHVRHVVLSAGTRNIPLVHSIEADAFFSNYSIVDERSAGYFAIGLIQRLNEPVAVVCTSGTAAANYMPAMNEAFYQNLPLVAITADRHPYYLNQLEDQMIQQNIFSHVSKAAVQLPVVADDKDFWYCNRLLNEAFMEMRHNGDGPIHINVPIEANLASFTTKTLPSVKLIERVVVGCEPDRWAQKIDKLKAAEKVLVLYGQAQPVSGETRQKIEEFSRKYDCLIVADHLSNLDHDDGIETFTFSRLATKAEVEKLKPEIVITLNGNFLSYLGRFLKSMNGFEHWHVAPDGRVADPFRQLTTVFQADAANFFSAFSEAIAEMKTTNSYRSMWKKHLATIKTQPIPYSHLFVVKSFIESLPEKTIIHLANSSAVRLAQHFKLPSNVRVYCNRGTHGIDGSVSSFAGAASVSSELCFLLIGDLSFFYDMNGLWNRYVGKNVRILLNNNRGAGIFHYTIGKEKVPTLNQNIAAEHHSSAKGWVKSLGFEYLTASTEDEYLKYLPRFLSEDSDSPILFEVFTNKEEDAQTLRSFYNANKNQNGKLYENAKKTLRKIKRRF